MLVCHVKWDTGLTDEDYLLGLLLEVRRRDRLGLFFPCFRETEKKAPQVVHLLFVTKFDDPHLEQVTRNLLSKENYVNNILLFFQYTYSSQRTIIDATDRPKNSLIN